MSVAELETTALTRVEASGYALLPVAQVKAQVQQIQALIREVMVEGQHFGSMPGSKKGGKEEERKVLYKSGAELLNVMLRLRADYDVEREELEEARLFYRIKCKLVHIATGDVFASGDGSCNSHEVKYRYRKAQRACPACGAAAILRSKEGDEYFCWRKKDGCGKTFPLGTPEIEEQVEGKVDNPDPYDLANTILKMACKRALVAATLNATACSDTFTQDVEDEAETDPAPRPAAKKPAQRDAGPAIARCKELVARCPEAWRQAIEHDVAAANMDVERLEWIAFDIEASLKNEEAAAKARDEAAAKDRAAKERGADEAARLSAEAKARAEAQAAGAKAREEAAAKTTVTPPANGAPPPGPAQPRAGRPAYGGAKT